MRVCMFMALYKMGGDHEMVLALTSTLYPLTQAPTDTWTTCYGWMHAVPKYRHDFRHAWKKCTAPFPGGNGIAIWPLTQTSVSGHTL